MSQEQPPVPDSSEQRWERIERNLDRVTDRLDRMAASQEASEHLAQQQRGEFEQFRRTMAAVVESLHKMDLRLDANLQMLSGLAA